MCTCAPNWQIPTENVLDIIYKHRKNMNGVDDNNDIQLCILFPAELKLMVNIIWMGVPQVIFQQKLFVI